MKRKTRRLVLALPGPFGLFLPCSAPSADSSFAVHLIFVILPGGDAFPASVTWLHCLAQTFQLAMHLILSILLVRDAFPGGRLDLRASSFGDYPGYRMRIFQVGKGRFGFFLN